MDRVKLIERLKKLLAMSRDSSSPAEAAIAARRMDALMEKYDVSLAEITGSDQDYFRRNTSERAPRPSARRKRKRARPRVQRKRTVRPVILAACGIAIAVSAWFVLTRVDEFRLITTGAVARHAVDNSRLKAPSLYSKVERSSIMEGEAIVLYVTGTAVSSVPNTSRLLQDFRIIKTQINQGTDTQGFQMRLELKPRQTGMLYIPSFYVDGVRSKAIIIDVVARK